MDKRPCDKLKYLFRNDMAKTRNIKYQAVYFIVWQKTRAPVAIFERLFDKNDKCTTRSYK